MVVQDIQHSGSNWNPSVALRQHSTPRKAGSISPFVQRIDVLYSPFFEKHFATSTSFNLAPCRTYLVWVHAVPFRFNVVIIADVRDRLSSGQVLGCPAVEFAWLNARKGFLTRSLYSSSTHFFEHPSFLEFPKGGFLHFSSVKGEARF